MTSPVHAVPRARAPTVAIRPTAPADLARIVAWEGAPEHAAFVEAWAVERHGAALVDPEFRHFVVEVEGRPVGFALLAGLTDPARVIEFKRLVVTEKGRGIGRAAVKAVLHYLFDAWGAEEVWLDFVAGNDRAHRAYAACGFQGDPDTSLYATVNGNPVPLVKMSISRSTFLASLGPDGRMYEFTAEPSRLDLSSIHAFLTESYWARAVTRSTVERSIAGSLCFGVLERGATVAFARVITDQATFAYLADVFVLPAHRGRGLGKRLLREILADPRLQGMRHWVLRTRDAHGLYRQAGFKALETPETWMHRPGTAAPVPQATP